MNDERKFEKVRSLTRELVRALGRDEWPSNAVCVDFGIKTPAHLGALQYAFNHDGVTAEQFDEAMGWGEKLQRLVSPRNPYRHARFRTAWDEMRELRPGYDGDDAEGPDSTDGGESCDGQAMPEPTSENRPKDPEQGEDERLDAEGCFGEVIFAYTRRQAVADGVLIDVTETARFADFRFPVALSRAVWGRYVEVPEGVEARDEDGRLWDIVWMCRVALGRKQDTPELLFKLHVRNDNSQGEPPPVTLKAVCGPDDDGKPCITIMLPDES